MTALLKAALEYSALGWATIPIESGKRPPRGFTWSKYQTDKPDEVELSRWFNRARLSGLAVILGPVSGGLYCRDFDQTESYQKWASLHPAYAKTLPTSLASRGPHVYFNSNLELSTRTYKDGELRGIGAYVVVPPSIHASGHVYSWTTSFPLNQPKTIDPVAIGLCRSYTYQNDRTVQREQRGQRELRRSETTEEVVSCDGQKKRSAFVEKIVSESMPTIIHENHHKLFHLARGVKALEKQEQREFSDSELLGIFAQWYDRAKPFLRPEQSFDEYRFEFLGGLERVKYPLGEEVITEAWEKALEVPHPEIATQFRSVEVRTLVTLCRELQRSFGDKSFFLSCRTVARLFGHDTHTTAALWLRGLVLANILKVIERGRPETNKATRYQYLSQL